MINRQGFPPFIALLAVLVLLINPLGMLLAQADPIPDARILVNIPSRSLWLYSGDEIVKYYPVGVGKSNFPTPMGKFKVIRKVVDPVFENPFKPSRPKQSAASKYSPLGTRWIGFLEDKGGEYGIHGTYEVESVGKLSSHGCIRMYIKDAEDLFSSVDFDTPVEVIYDPVLIHRSGDSISVIAFPDAFGLGMPRLEDVQEKILNQYPTLQIDEDVLAQSLKKPTEKPIVIGHIPPSDDAPVLTVKGRLIPLSAMEEPALANEDTMELRQKKP